MATTRSSELTTSFELLPDVLHVVLATPFLYPGQAPLPGFPTADTHLQLRIPVA